MDLSAALKLVKSGAHITRPEWGDDDFHVKLVDDRLMIKTADKKYHPWIISGQDLFSSDWTTVKKETPECPPQMKEQ